MGSNEREPQPSPDRMGEPEMTKVTEIGDDALLARMLAGDEEAFVLLYRRRHPAIYRYALHMSGNRANRRGCDPRGFYGPDPRRQAVRSGAGRAGRVSDRHRPQPPEEALGAGSQAGDLGRRRAGND